jgi:hypothetical protein
MQDWLYMNQTKRAKRATTRPPKQSLGGTPLRILSVNLGRANHIQLIDIEPVAGRSLK